MMKKMLLMMLLAMLGAGAAVMWSCRKDASSVEGPEVRERVEDLGDDAAIEQKILDFNQKCDFLAKNPGVKSAGIVSSGEAGWLVEASLNYLYGFPFESASTSVLDSAGVLLAKTGNDSVSYMDLSACYYSLIDSVESLYARVLWENKRILLADVSLGEAADPGFYLVKMKLLTGVLRSIIPPFSNPYTPDDWWYYAGLAGHCGPVSGGYGSDAIREIETYHDWFINTGIPPAGCHYYFTNIETLAVNAEKYLNPNDAVANDNWCDYLLFRSDPALSGHHDCLSPDEMWFYLQSLYTICHDPAYEWGNTQPPFKDFMGFKLQDNQSSTGVISHRASLTYGFAHLSCDPALPTVPPYF